MARKKKQTKLTFENWTDLNARINNFSLEELEKALEMEQSREEPRPSFLKRLHQKIVRMRGNEERSNLLG